LRSFRTNAVAEAAFAGAAARTLPATKTTPIAAVKVSPIRTMVSLHREWQPDRRSLLDPG